MTTSRKNGRARKVVEMENCGKVAAGGKLIECKRTPNVACCRGLVGQLDVDGVKAGPRAQAPCGNQGARMLNGSV